MTDVIADLVKRLRRAHDHAGVHALVKMQEEVDTLKDEIGRLLKPGLPQERMLDGARALVLYFATDEDVTEFVEIFKEVKPNCRTVRVK